MKDIGADLGVKNTDIFVAGLSSKNGAKQQKQQIFSGNNPKAQSLMKKFEDSKVNFFLRNNILN